jgi:hypothetical protein
VKKKTPPTQTINPTRKLRLSRVTVRPLTVTELASVAAGARAKGSMAETDNQCQTVP